MSVRKRVTTRVVELFSHSERPLSETTKYLGDKGLFGAGSISWEILGDVSSFVGGIRALMIQAAHPEVAAGVADHSRYREDPLGRLSRTAYYVTSMTYGSLPEIDDALKLVARAHTGVTGISERGIPYSASSPEYGAWVHNTLTDSFLQAFITFRRPASIEEMDTFVQEQSLIGERMGADPLPRTAGELRKWVIDHPEVEPSKAMSEAIAFLRKPPLPKVELLGYRILQKAAVSTIDPNLREILGIGFYPFAQPVGKQLVRSLRWALKYSPAWKAALLRVGADFDHRLFREDA